MEINPKIILIGLGSIILLPLIIWFFIKKPYLLVAAIVLGAIAILPVVERKVGLK